MTFAPKSILKTSFAALLATIALSLAPAFAEGQVEILHWWTTGGGAVAVSKYKEALAKAGVTWKDVAGAGNENQRTLLRTRVMKGAAPAAGEVAADIKQFAGDKDKLFDLSAVAAEGKWDAVLPPVIQAYVKMGCASNVDIPLNVQRMSAMWVSAAALKKVGATEAPKAWDEFFALADKAKAAGITPFARGNNQVLGEPRRGVSMPQLV